MVGGGGGGGGPRRTKHRPRTCGPRAFVGCFVFVSAPHKGAKPFASVFSLCFLFTCMVRNDFRPTTRRVPWEHHAATVNARSRGHNAETHFRSPSHCPSSKEN